MSATINRATVRLARDQQDPRKVAIEVLVISDRPGLRAMQSIDPGRVNSAKELAFAVGAAAAVAAEHLCKKYSDKIDPYATSRDAILALGEEMRLVGELQKGVPEKVRRLVQNRSQLSSAAGEKIDAWAWAVNHSQAITTADALEIDGMIAQLHSAQLG